nr:DNA damage-regulated autophagy modulator protein 1 isoform X1 [Pan troglodytes]
MAWVSPRGGHSHCCEAPAAGPRRGRPRGARPGTPEIPREGGVGRNKSFSPELRKSQRGRARVGRPERASPPVTPRRPSAPNPASAECPNQKRKEPDPRVPSGGSVVASAWSSPGASDPAGPLCDFTRFATSPGSPRPTHSGPAASPPAASLRSSRFPSLRGWACPGRRGASPPTVRECTRPAAASRQPGATRRPAPLGAALRRRRRRRDAVLPEGNGFRPLPLGDLVVSRLHYLLRGRRALRARQPLPPVYQVQPRCIQDIK